MNTLLTYWEMAQLAQASYIDLSGTSAGTVRRNLTDSQPQVFYKLSETQAARLIGDATGFTVADRTANLNDAIGFSGTLFFDNRTGKYTLGLRGTENTPLTNIDFLTSAQRIIVWGVAYEQIVAMYNYVQRLVTPVGDPVLQRAVEIIILPPGNPPADGRQYIPLGGTYVTGGSYLASRQFTANNAIGTLAQVLQEGGTINVVGHSLGGHLAQAFQRLFPQLTDTAYAFNTAGFRAGTADPFFQILNPANTGFDDNKIKNIYSYTGAEFKAKGTGVEFFFTKSHVQQAELRSMKPCHAAHA